MAWCRTRPRVLPFSTEKSALGSSTCTASRLSCWWDGKGRAGATVWTEIYTGGISRCFHWWSGSSRAGRARVRARFARLRVVSLFCVLLWWSFPQVSVGDGQGEGDECACERQLSM